MLVKLTYACTTCSYVTTEVVEVPVSPECDCPECVSEGTMYVTSIEVPNED